MNQFAQIIRAFVGSPTDLENERKIIPEVIEQWNVMNSLHRSVIIHPVRWETHASPNLELPAQALINRELVDHCDFLIAVFWTTLGSGGTVEEIERFRTAKKRVILYFSEQAIPQSKIDPTKWMALQDFRRKMEGLYGTFKTEEELRQKLLRDVNDAVEKLLAGDVAQLVAQEFEKTDLVSEVTDLIANVQSRSIPLAQCVADAMRIAKKANDEDLEQFCRRELTGWSQVEKAGPPDRRAPHRQVEAFISAVEINVGSPAWANAGQMFDYMRNDKENFRPTKMLISQPLSQLEAVGPVDPSKAIVKMSVPARSLLPTVSPEIANSEVFIYIRADSYSRVLEAIRVELTTRLVDLLPKSPSA